ncbi:MAG TPA: hypothetical protein VFD59_13225 [Nocardioidaceae bacterium]|nr:hypothetical protein [Nocardioidaceae bacterium]
MGFQEIVTLPVRLTVAATEITLSLATLVADEGPIRRQGGYAERVMLLIGEGGLIDRLAHALARPDGPARLVNTLAALTAEDRPLGRALAPGGTLDRMVAEDGALTRLLAEGGALDRLVAQGGPLERLLADGGALDRITEDGGALDRILSENGLLDRLVVEDGFLEKLVAEGGTLDQLVALGASLEAVHPRLSELARLIPDLHDAVETLSQVVEPLGDLANRIPGSRRRPSIQA